MERNEFDMGGDKLVEIEWRGGNEGLDEESNEGTKTKRMEGRKVIGWK